MPSAHLPASVDLAVHGHAKRGTDSAFGMTAVVHMGADLVPPSTADPVRGPAG
ncbi:MAG: hypothetical protein IPM08_04175 [Actinomycetales bacterium]|nr:hypothetical protein [Actinomycetales bacterium]